MSPIIESVLIYICDGQLYDCKKNVLIWSQKKEGLLAEWRSIGQSLKMKIDKITMKTYLVWPTDKGSRNQTPGPDIRRGEHAQDERVIAVPLLGWPPW